MRVPLLLSLHAVCTHSSTSGAKAAPERAMHSVSGVLRPIEMIDSFLGLGGTRINSPALP
jgi:hypothetical protein